MESKCQDGAFESEVRAHLNWIGWIYELLSTMAQTNKANV